MKIGELALQSGVPAATIRYYESIGLLKAVERRSNGYRSYPPQALLTLQLIRRGQAAGFSLAELSTLLPADLVQWQQPALQQALVQKIADIEQLEQQLAHSKSQLQQLLHEISHKPADVSCVDNASRVLAGLPPLPTDHIHKPE